MEISPVYSLHRHAFACFDHRRQDFVSLIQFDTGDELVAIFHLYILCVDALLHLETTEKLLSLMREGPVKKLAFP